MNIAFCNWKVVLPRFRHRKATGIRKCETCFSLCDCDEFFCTFLTPDFQNAIWPSQKRKKRNCFATNRGKSSHLRTNEWMHSWDCVLLSFEKSNTWCSETCVDPSFGLKNAFCVLYRVALAEIARCWNETTSARPKVLHFTFNFFLSPLSSRVSFTSHRVCRKINSCLKCEWGIT